ncbi:hypothetical protein [Streptomyces sp. NPDC096351]|uniref:hypothetical protein n=1 Tax=Streptomyces sp. NPDC096351 TaxID=3366087 RepID=UPI0038233DD4
MIHLAHRRRRPFAAEPLPEPPASPAFELALTVQAMYQSRGQSLNDPATAAAFETALDAVILVAHGAHATQILDDEAWAHMKTMLTEMRHAPDRV